MRANIMGNLLRRLLKKEKSKEEIQQEQYSASLNETTTYYNGVRINEILVGKIRSARMDDCIVQAPKTDGLLIQKSTQRPLDFGDNMFSWFDHIRNEAKELINKNRLNEEKEKSYIEAKKKEMQEKALAKSREFFVQYGVLNKTHIAA